MASAGEVILVVRGSTTSLGKGIATEFLNRGSKVIVPSVARRNLKDIFDATVNPDNLIFFEADVGTESGCQELAKFISENYKLSHVVSSIGTWWQEGSALQQDLEEFHNVIHDNCCTNFLVAKHILPLVKDQEGSTYTIITGISGEHMVQPNTGLLTIAQSALFGLIAALQEEFKDAKVRLNEYRTGLYVRPPDQVEEGDPKMASNLDVAKDIINRILKDPSVKNTRIESRTVKDLKLE